MRRTTDIGADRVETLLHVRADANAQFFTAEAERVSRLCHKMAERFAREGRLVAFGASPADRSDARHVAVEFVHPVIVGKRALPALGLAGEGGAIAPQVALEAEADDIAMAFGSEPDILAALAAARERGCLTIAFTRDSGAEWEFDLAGAIEDRLIRQEIAETLYHTLWEHVHIFLDNRGLLEGRAARPVHD
nr:phosphoheptose isomerase [Solirubrobacterales bacterium]